jgi:hypothetical protein
MKLVPVFVVLSILASGCASMPPVRRGALKCATRQTGSSKEELELLKESARTLPETGQIVHDHIFVSGNGLIARCAVDDDGRVLNLDDVAEAERAARVKNHGHLSPRVERAIEGREDSEMVHVVLHVPVFEPQSAAGSNLLRDPQAAAAERKRVDDIVQRALPKLRSFLGKKTEIEAFGNGTPFVKAYLTVKQIAKLGRTDMVGNIYIGEPQRTRSLGTNTCRINQYALTGADKAHSVLGLTGKGVKVATLEQPCKSPLVPFDPSDPQHNLTPSADTFTSPACKSPRQHATDVLGFIATTNPYDGEQNPPDPKVFGMAPHAELFSSYALNAGPYTSSDPNGWWAEYWQEYNWLTSKGIALVNSSIALIFEGTPCPEPPSVLNEITDYWATHAPYILTVAAAGDYPAWGGCATNKVVNFMHNGITVGPAFDHQVKTCPTCPYTYTLDTDRTLDWTGHGYLAETIFTWANPDANSSPMEVGDFELPQMSAYAGDTHDNLEPAPSQCDLEGTSFSAPLITGAAALVAEENPDMYGRPEALRAVLYAGADVNLDMNTPDFGPSYSFQPIYNRIGLGGGVDRHGGMGLLNVDATTQIAKPSSRIPQNNYYGMGFTTAFGNVPTANSNYQQSISAQVGAQKAAPALNGYDYGVMDPKKDFLGIWYKNYYFFAPTQSGNLRIVLTWNRPYTCTKSPLSCGPDFKPGLDMVLRDLATPKGFVATAASWDPNEQFMAAKVQAGHLYRLDIDMQNAWPGPNSFGLASWFTTNPQ